MKIMKVKDKSVGKVTYYKYRVNLPVKMIEDMNLLNKPLKVSVQNKKIVIEEE